MRTTTRLWLGLILTVSMCFYLSCRKTDIRNEPINTANSFIENRFFNSHRSNNLKETSLVNFLKKINEKDEFVSTTVERIGYPRWDKTVSFTNTPSSISSREPEDTTEVFYVPFVRDSQNFVNASMLIKTTPTDTSFYFKCDWQFRFKENGSPSIDSSAEKHALLFMLLDKVTFGYNEFKLLDTMLFRLTNTPINDERKLVLLTDSNSNSNVSSLYYHEICFDFYVCGTRDYCAGHGGCDYLNCPTGECYLTNSYCEGWWDDGGGDGDSGGTPGGTTGGGGSGTTGGGTTPPECDVVPVDPLIFARVVDPCDEGPGWVPIDDDPIPVLIDVVSDPNAPEYPDISDGEPQVSLQSLFNCFAQIPDAGATYSVKLCVDLPVNGVWNAPFNLTHKSPGHTFLTLTKTNGNQIISQSVGFYPIGSGGNPYNPNATGGFKNNGLPIHEYNAAIKADNVTASQFSAVMNNLLSHENDTYNIFGNNCTTIALNAFNLLITPPITVAPFVVQIPTNPPQPPFFFMQSPQKLYKSIESLQPGANISKEFDVTSNSPYSILICP